MARSLHHIDHRWGQRFRVDIPVLVFLQASAGINGQLRDLSLSGALVKADFDLRLHSLVKISILTSAWPRPSPIIGYIARNCAEGAGVEWCEFGHRTIKDLLRVTRPQLVGGRS